MYSSKQISRLDRMEQFHFWAKARQKLIVALLEDHAKGKRVLDIGCGTGNLIALLKQKAYFAIGVDPHPNASLRANGDQLPFPDGQFDAAVMADVLEHMKEPMAPLSEAFRVLAKEGILLITVPAFPWLWGRRDEEAGHLRRYVAKDLHAMAQKLGGRIVYLNYYQFFLFPLFALSRLCKLPPSKEERIPKWLNSIFFSINKIEVSLANRIRWPWGSSLIAVIKKEPL